MTSKIRKFFPGFRSLGIGAALLLAIWFTTAIAAPAQTFTVLVNFDWTDGAMANSVVQGIDGNFYGTTVFGWGGDCNIGYGYGGCGTVFKMTPSGTLTTLYEFCPQPYCADGNTPDYTVVLGTDGNFYGVTQFGGFTQHGSNIGYGTVFKVTPTGALTTLHVFSGPDGYEPLSMMQAADGNFYGVAAYGGTEGDGTIFKITSAGKLTVLHSFDSTDGATPIGEMVQGTDGNLYGTTVSGGAYGSGTVFKITLSGTLTTLYNFCSQANCDDGATPYAGVVQGTDGNFYGATYYGGTGGNGVVFKITSAGVFSPLYSFCSQTNCDDGANPASALVQGTDGNFYGATNWGGGNGVGELFEISASGTFTPLHAFETTDGYYNKRALIQGTDGIFYGGTELGGALGSGTVYSLSMGLGPFVKTIPSSGQVGTAVTILGNNLAGATSVTFNGTPATFTASSTYITTTVPTGTTTGLVEVTTPTKTLKSNVLFRVP